MPDQLQLRGGTTAEHSAFTGASKEVTVDTSKKTVVVHDGTTAGGVPLLRQDGSNSALALGSVGTPSLKWDSNTGIYSPGEDQLAISTGGTSRLHITSAGLVGIGTSSPDAKLEVVDTASSLTYPIAVSNFTDPATDVGAAVDFRLTTGGNSRGYIACRYTSNSSTDGTYLSFAPNDGSTGNVERMRITKAGLVGIGTTSPVTQLHVDGSGNQNIRVSSTTHSNFIQVGCGSGSTYHEYKSVYRLVDTDSGERARIDSSGRLLVGTSSTSAAARVLVSGGDGARGVLNIASTAATPADGDDLGFISFNDSSHIYNSALIRAQRDGGTWTATTSKPTRLVFSTTADQASSPTERMRITNAGSVLLGNTSFDATVNMAGFGNLAPTDDKAQLLIANTEATDTAALVIFNRHTSDGRLLQFRQANTTEGTISVSGTTVTYGGGHLARWSQLPNDEDPSSILKGTVMSNLDDMCEWGDEDNEQLNKTTISDIEGDPNVAGVFVSTSFDEEGPSDFFVAMTGDMVIRIAEGVTVERGDLLMSAGDGTAKPQDDDIIRSKTIAKVTSTNVSCTYDDGSYCVPCVLMAC